MAILLDEDSSLPGLPQLQLQNEFDNFLLLRVRSNDPIPSIPE